MVITDKKKALEYVLEDGFNLKDCSDELRNDKEVVLAAVRNEGLALQFASEELHKDIPFLQECLAVNPMVNFYIYFINKDILKKSKDKGGEV